MRLARRGADLPQSRPCREQSPRQIGGPTVLVILAERVARDALDVAHLLAHILCVVLGLGRLSGYRHTVAFQTDIRVCGPGRWDRSAFGLRGTS
eukprot:4753756-Alexandrium_andersonii.AAC.1